MFDEKIREGKWIIGVSGGPDSMALLDMLVQEKVKVVVAHVNYHKRDTADRDQKCVENYCRLHQIDFHLLSPHYTSGNFQSWARDVRYQFFFELTKSENAEGVLIAHHLEDSVETYLLQKERNADVDVLGLVYHRKIQGVTVLRPLLGWTKAELIQYCDDHHVEFHHDESNFSDDYHRNEIRHEEVEHYSKEELLKIADEIEQLNQKKKQQMDSFDEVICHHELSVHDLLKCDEKIGLLRRFLMKENYRSTGYANAFCEELLGRIERGNNFKVKIDHRILILDYDVLYFEEKEIEYEDMYSMISFGEKEYYTIDSDGDGINAVTVSEDDFPLTIRNWHQEDEIQLRFGMKKVNRFFIDRKIRNKDRNGWPVVVNCKGQIILVAGLGCDVNHYSQKPSFFVRKNVVQ